MQSSAALGLGATTLFWLALILFAALDPSYSHAINAVSELGSKGAPHQMLWNLIGFIGPGLLLAAFGWRLGRNIDDLSTAILLSLFGLAFAATAIPADLNDLRGPATTAHIVASYAVLAFWAAGLSRLIFVRRLGRSVKMISVIALVMAVGSIILRGSELLPGGWSQRVTFAVVFGWVLVISLLALRRELKIADDSSPLIRKL